MGTMASWLAEQNLLYEDHTEENVFLVRADNDADINCSTRGIKETKPGWA